MAITSKGSMGVGADSSSGSSYSMTTATTALAAGNIALLVSVSDNTSTVDGDNSEITRVTDSGGNTWTKLAEYTNSPTAAVADGVTVSIWLTRATAAVAIGGTITITFVSNRTDKCCSAWAYTVATNSTLTKATNTPVTSEVNGANDFGSSAFSGLASLQRLYLRGLGKEANSLTDLTVSSGFTLLTLNRSRNNTNAVMVRGEFRVNTSTGETSNPACAVSGDTAGVFVALEEINEELPVMHGSRHALSMA